MVYCCRFNISGWNYLGTYLFLVRRDVMDIILSAFEYPFVGLFLFSLYVWGNGHFIGYW